MKKLDSSDSHVIDKDPVKEKEKLKPPPLYNVFILNDAVSSVYVVIMVVRRVFNKTPEEAERITIEAHKHGKALAGVYAKDIAESKVVQVAELAKANGAPQLTALAEQQ